MACCAMSPEAEITVSLPGGAGTLLLHNLPGVRGAAWSAGTLVGGAEWRLKSSSDSSHQTMSHGPGTGDGSGMWAWVRASSAFPWSDRDIIPTWLSYPC